MNFLLNVDVQANTRLMESLFTNENIQIILVSLFASVVGALITQIFHITNISKAEKTRIGGLLAEDKYKLYTQLSRLVATLLTYEDTSTVFPSVKFPQIKGNPSAQYHAIFNSWADFNAFYHKLDDIFKEHSYMFPIPVYILYIVFIKYWHLLSFLAAGPYGCDDDTLFIFGLFCFSDITKWAGLMKKQCNRILNNPKLSVKFDYNIRYRLTRRYYFMIFAKSNLSDLQNRFLMLDTSKQGNIEFPELFENWYDIASSIKLAKAEQTASKDT